MPSINFYKRDKENYFEEKTSFLGNDYRAIRLKNIHLTPMPSNLNWKLEIFFGYEDKAHFSCKLSDLYKNPTDSQRLFFLEGKNQWKDIALPNESISLTYKLTPTMPTEDFELMLACIYV